MSQQTLKLGSLELLDSQGLAILPAQSNVHFIISVTRFDHYTDNYKTEVTLFPIEVSSITETYLTVKSVSLYSADIQSLKNIITKVHLKKAASLRLTTDTEEISLGSLSYLFCTNIEGSGDYKTVGYKAEFYKFKSLT